MWNPLLVRVPDPDPWLKESRILHVILENKLKMWMKFSEWLERLITNAKVATVLGSVPASYDTMESEGRHMKQC